MLQRAAQLGDRLVVGVSTDEFNLSKAPTAPHHNASPQSPSLLLTRCTTQGKRSVISFQDRARIVRQIP